MDLNLLREMSIQHGRGAWKGSERREAFLGLDFEKWAGIWRAELTGVAEGTGFLAHEGQ